MIFSGFRLAVFSFLPASPLFASLTQNFELYGARSVADLELFQQWGITQVITDNDALLKYAGEKGMRTVQANWFNVESPWDTVRARVKSALTIPLLRTINLMDEPIYNGPTFHPPVLYEDLRKRILTEFPSARLSLTEYGPDPAWPMEKKELFAKYLRSVDVLRIDPYPVLAKKPLRTVYDWITEARRLMGENPVPVVTILQTWAETPELPTVDELRVMAYQVLLAESETLSFFDYSPTLWQKVLGFTENFQKLLQEMRDLASRYQACSIQSTMTETGVLKAEVSCPQNRLRISVNTNPFPAENLSPYKVLVE